MLTPLNIAPRYASCGAALAAAGDLNGDGIPDFIAACGGRQLVAVFPKVSAAVTSAPTALVSSGFMLSSRQVDNRRDPQAIITATDVEKLGDGLPNGLNITAIAASDNRPGAGMLHAFGFLLDVTPSTPPLPLPPPPYPVAAQFPCGLLPRTTSCSCVPSVLPLPLFPMNASH